MIKVFKDGDRMAISTDCTDERDFHQQFSQLLAELIDDGWAEHDWEFQLCYWLPQFVEICCHLRGYKSTVHVQQLVTAGEACLPDEIAMVTDRNEVLRPSHATMELAEPSGTATVAQPEKPKT